MKYFLIPLIILKKRICNTSTFQANTRLQIYARSMGLKGLKAKNKKSDISVQKFPKIFWSQTLNQHTILKIDMVDNSGSGSRIIISKFHIFILILFPFSFYLNPAPSLFFLTRWHRLARRHISCCWGDTVIRRRNLITVDNFYTFWQDL